MPLVSESLIQKAYGPTDLSGFYNSIDTYYKQAAAEAKAQKIALQKEYYTNLATYNKDQTGVRDEDIPEITEHYSKWKAAQQQLMNNPTLLQKNPKLYGELNAESNTQYMAAIGKSNISKAKRKDIEQTAAYIRSHPDEYEDEAHQNYLNSTKKPTSQLLSTNEDDAERLKYGGIKTKDLVDNTNKIYKSAITKARIEKYKDEFGTVSNEFEIADPTALVRSVGFYIHSQKNPEKASTVGIKNAGQDYKSTSEEYSKMPESYFAQFKNPDGSDKFPEMNVNGVKTRKPILNFNSNFNTENFTSYLVAKGILGGQPKEGKEFTQFNRGKMGEKEYNASLALKSQKMMESIRQANRQSLQKTGAALRLGELQEGKQLDGMIKLLSGVVGTEAKLDINMGDPLDDAKIDNIIGKLRKVVEKVKTTPKSGVAVSGKKDDKL